MAVAARLQHHSEQNLCTEFLMKYVGERLRWPMKYPKTKKETSERLRKKGDVIIYFDFCLEGGKILGKGIKKKKTLHRLLDLRMNDDLWDIVRGLGSETWKGCE